MELGNSMRGARKIIPIIGGHVEGRHLNGKVLSLGADWQTVFENGVAELDTRYCIETYDGALIDIRNFGYRHGSKDVLAALARGEHVVRPNITCAPSHVSKLATNVIPGSTIVFLSDPGGGKRALSTYPCTRFCERFYRI